MRFGDQGARSSSACCSPRGSLLTLRASAGGRQLRRRPLAALVLLGLGAAVAFKPHCSRAMGDVELRAESGSRVGRRGTRRSMMGGALGPWRPRQPRRILDGTTRVASGEDQLVPRWNGGYHRAFLVGAIISLRSGRSPSRRRSVPVAAAARRAGRTEGLPEAIGLPATADAD